MLTVSAVGPFSSCHVPIGEFSLCFCIQGQVEALATSYHFPMNYNTHTKRERERGKRERSLSRVNASVILTEQIAWQRSDHHLAQEKERRVGKRRSMKKREDGHCCGGVDSFIANTAHKCARLRFNSFVLRFPLHKKRNSGTLTFSMFGHLHRLYSTSLRGSSPRLTSERIEKARGYIIIKCGASITRILAGFITG